MEESTRMILDSAIKFVEISTIVTVVLFLYHSVSDDWKNRPADQGKKSKGVRTTCKSSKI